LKEEVGLFPSFLSSSPSSHPPKSCIHSFFFTQRLMGASLLVFANKQDIGNAMSVEEISIVGIFRCSSLLHPPYPPSRLEAHVTLPPSGPRPRNALHLASLLDPALFRPLFLLSRRLASLFRPYSTYLCFLDIHKSLYTVTAASSSTNGPSNHDRTRLGGRRGRWEGVLRHSERDGNDQGGRRVGSGRDSSSCNSMNARPYLPCDSSSSPFLSQVFLSVLIEN
jgi:hypothetical protein